MQTSTDDTFYLFPYLEQIYPCDLQPCKNGATCTNDPDDISLHHCQCPAWFTGQNCEGLRSFYAERMSHVNPVYSQPKGRTCGPFNVQKNRLRPSKTNILLGSLIKFSLRYAAGHKKVSTKGYCF